MLHILDKIIDETAVTRVKAARYSERRRESVLPRRDGQCAIRLPWYRANVREYLFCQVIGNLGSGTV
jgi:hypothetical protein